MKAQIRWIFFKNLKKFIKNDTNNENWLTVNEYVDTLNSWSKEIIKQEQENNQIQAKNKKTRELAVSVYSWFVEEYNRLNKEKTKQCPDCGNIQLLPPVKKQSLQCQKCKRTNWNYTRTKENPYQLQDLTPYFSLNQIYAQKYEIFNNFLTLLKDKEGNLLTNEYTGELKKRLEEWKTHNEGKDLDPNPYEITVEKRTKDTLQFVWKPVEQEIERLMKEAIELRDKLKKSDESKQSLLEEMKPKLLTDEEEQILEELRKFWDNLGGVINDQYFPKEKFIDKIKKIRSELTFRSFENYPKLGHIVYLKEHLIPNFLKVVDYYQKENNNRPNISLTEWENDYSKRHSEIEWNYLNSKVNTLNQELTKERDWWDKWINDGKEFITSTDKTRDYYVRANFPNNEILTLANVYYLDKEIKVNCYRDGFGDGGGNPWIYGGRSHNVKLNPSDLTFSTGSRSELKKQIKEKIYQYYLNK